KSARGGVPRSMWETYSAMANTQGGVIVLGIEEKDDLFSVSGVDDVAQKQKNIWDCLNNRSHVSVNLLASSDVYVREVQGKPVIVMRVPRASRHERPVFIGLNPLEGTYRRNYTGDYKCNREEVGRMPADQSEN